MRYGSWIIVLLLGPLVLAVQSVPRPRLPTWNDALAAALLDLKSAHPLDQPFQRYIWVTDGNPITAKAVVWGQNIISRATVIQRAEPLGKGKLLLLRLDLRSYATRTADLKDYLTTWEELQFEPKLNLLVTKDALVQLKDPIPKVKQKSVRRVQTKKRVNDRIKTVSHNEEFEELVPITESVDLDKVGVVRFPASHVSQIALNELMARSNSQAPLVTHGYFVTRALGTIQDAGLFKTLYGGLYYEFAGIKENKTGKGTDEDLWFQDHIGLGDISSGLTAAKIYDRLRSDRRAAVWKSKITGKPRRIDYGHGPQDGDGFGPWSVTHDPKDQDIDTGRHPMFNLLDLKDAAREAIWGRANGLHGYALFNGQGKLQREVPPDVAVNREIPSPHTARLQAGIGCISCHEVKADGWQPLANDVRDLLAGVLGDTSNARRTIPDTYDRLHGLYGSEDFQVAKWRNRGIEDYAGASLRATGPLPNGDPTQKDIIRRIGSKLWSIYKDYNYEQVNARMVLADLGLDVAAEDATKGLATLLPPTQNLGAGVPEDVRILALLKGQSLNRVDYDLVFSFIAQRAAPKLK